MCINIVFPDFSLMTECTCNILSAGGSVYVHTTKFQPEKRLGMLCILPCTCTCTVHVTRSKKLKVSKPIRLHQYTYKLPRLPRIARHNKTAKPP